MYENGTPKILKVVILQKDRGAQEFMFNLELLAVFKGCPIF